MWGIPTGLLVRIALIAALAIAAVVAKHRYDAGEQAIGAARVQLLWDQDKAQRMEQVSRINQERVDAVAKADLAARDAERDRAIAFARERSRIPAGPVDSSLARRLLDDAIRTANGQPAASSGESPTNPAVTSEPADFGPWVRWGEQVAEIYSACREQVIDWNRFYDDLRGVPAM